MTGPGRALPADARSACAAAQERIDGLIIASPANPTGSMIDAADLGGARPALRRRRHPPDLGRDLSRHRLWQRRRRRAALGDDAIIVNSFSKYFSMTGWRIGWMIVPPEMLRAVECLAQKSLHLAAGAVAARRARGLRLRPTSSRQLPRATPTIARCCWPSCRKPASSVSRPPTVRSTSMPISRR